MLVINREAHQEILIGDNIVITVVEIQVRDGMSKIVRLGISAPKSVVVARPVHLSTEDYEAHKERANADSTNKL